MTSVISLEDVLAPGRSTVLSGRADGAYARERFDLDALEAKGEKVVIEVPTKVREMTPSFVLGLFSATLKKMADGKLDLNDLKQRFFAVYEFRGAASAHGDVEMAINDYVDVEMSLAGFAALAERGRAQ